MLRVVSANKMLTFINKYFNQYLLKLVPLSLLRRCSAHPRLSRIICQDTPGGHKRSKMFKYDMLYKVDWALKISNFIPFLDMDNSDN